MTTRHFVLSFGLLACSAMHAQEVCNNAIDDDFDGLIDLNDTTDCVCTAILGAGDVESIIPNPSFEDMSCCPQSYSELNCAMSWVQATNASSDYFHTCGFFPSWISSPLPDGDGCVGGYQTEGYQEYVGACLLQPMLTGESYTLEMDIAAYLADNFSLQTTQPINFGAVDVIVYGFPSCPSFPINTQICPEPDGWIPLGSVLYDPSEDWQSVTISFTPAQDIYAVIIGAPCDLPASYGTSSDPDQYYPYFLYDNLTMNESAQFGGTVTVTGGWCTEDLVLHGNPDTVVTNHQWYYEGVALIGQVDTLLGLSALGLDTGNYQFLASILDTTCAISTIHIPGPEYPAPLLSAVPTQACAPLNAAFTNNTDPAMVGTVVWNFGDGSPTSNAAAPNHIYTAPGTYDVSLEVTSPEGCVSDTTYVDLINVYDFPQVDFTADVLEGCLGLQVQFTNSSTLTGACNWDFGDGTAASLDCDALHTFNVADTFSVTLTVTSPQGCVSDTTFSDYINVYAFPDVSFESDTIAGCTPLAIQFTNTTPAGQVGTVLWNLGNGLTSTENNPSTVYPDAGTYSVSLSVTAPAGCEANITETDLITAYGHPEVSLFNTPDSGCYVLPVAFTNTTDPLFTGTCIWDFGDGSTGADCNPLHDYPDPGVYQVFLHVISPQNCEGDTATTTITVFDHPTAAFVFGPQPTDFFDTYISFVDSSSVDVVQWDWSFGQDGVLGQSSEEFPSLSFPSNDMGEYPVQLIVTNANTCQDTADAIVVIDGNYSVYAPNAFTPDGDGINEGFRPFIMDQDERLYRLTIFDRWGQSIWESTDPNKAWDGRMGGEVIKSDVYVWKLETRDELDRLNHEYIGHVTLLK
jgi:gliding motility-associated-like protein